MHVRVVVIELLHVAGLERLAVKRNGRVAGWGWTGHYTRMISTHKKLSEISINYLGEHSEGYRWGIRAAVAVAVASVVAVRNSPQARQSRTQPAEWQVAGAVVAAAEVAEAAGWRCSCP